MPAVDALAAAVGVASVDQEGDAKGIAGARAGGPDDQTCMTRMEGGGRRAANPLPRSQAGRGVAGPGVSSRHGRRTRDPSDHRRDGRPLARGRRSRGGRRHGHPPGWTDIFDGRTDLVVAAADGSTPPAVVTADVRRWAADGAGRATTSWWSSPATAGLITIGAESARRPGAAPRRRGDLAGGFVARARSRSRSNATTCATSRLVPLDGSAWPVRVSHADYAWDPAWSPDGAGLAWHEWDLPDMPWDASRVVIRRIENAAKPTRGCRSGGDAVAASQPRFSPDGAQLAFDLRRRRLAASCGSATPTARTRRRCSSEHTRARGAGVGTGPTFVRVVARRHRARVVPQRRRLRPARDLRAGQAIGARALARAGTAGSTGAQAASCASRSGAVTPPQVVVLAANGSGRRAIARGPVGGFEATGLVEPRAGDVEVGRARRCTGLLWRAATSTSTGAAAAARCWSWCTAARPGRRQADWSPAVQAFVQRGWSVLQARLPWLDRARARVRAGARGPTGASATSPMSRPGSATR